MTPIVCIVGKPKSGKTTLITQLIPELKRRGYRVVTIKHSAHEFNIDQEGKDSWHHAEAGSDCSVISSPSRLSLNKTVDHDATPSELAKLIGNVYDVVLAEGFKNAETDKIEVHREAIGEPVCSPHDLIAMVTDAKLQLNIPRFPPDDIQGIADLIEEMVISKREQTDVSLFINDHPVHLNQFVANMFSNTIEGMVSSLKGIESPKKIDISIFKRI